MSHPSYINIAHPKKIPRSAPAFFTNNKSVVIYSKLLICHKIYYINK